MADCYKIGSLKNLKLDNTIYLKIHNYNANVKKVNIMLYYTIFHTCKFTNYPENPTLQHSTG